MEKMSWNGLIDCRVSHPRSWAKGARPPSIASSSRSPNASRPTSSLNSSLPFAYAHQMPQQVTQQQA
jgi:hypothetical protein